MANQEKFSKAAQRSLIKFSVVEGCKGV